MATPDLGATAPHGTLLETLGVELVEASADLVVLTMDVGPKVHQPMGALHGGASAALAESAASIGAFLSCEPGAEFAVGVELNISHLRGVRDGTITARAEPVRKGRSLHVWTIDITHDDGSLVATARCTVAIRPVRPAGPGDPSDGEAAKSSG